MGKKKEAHSPFLYNPNEAVGATTAKRWPSNDTFCRTVSQLQPKSHQ